MIHEVKAKDCALAVYVKNPATQTVKTRLAAITSEEEAKEFYQLSLNCLKEDLAELSSNCDVFICPSSFIDQSWAQVEWPDYQVLPQIDSPNLGARINTTFRELSQKGYQKILLIGSDAPSLPRSHLVECLEQLQTKNSVIGPAEDGGYYLIASSGELPNLNAISWSSSSVCEDTRKLLEEQGQSVGSGPTWYDVDNSKNFDRLYFDLKNSSGARQQLRQWLLQHQKLSVIVPLLNIDCVDKEQLAELSSLEPAIELIVIGSAVNLNSFEAIPLIKKITSNATTLAELYNTAAKHATGTSLLFLQNGHGVEQKTYSRILKELRCERDLGILHHQATDQKLNWTSEFIKKKLKLSETVETFQKYYFGIFCRRQLWKRVGSFADLPHIELNEWIDRAKNMADPCMLSMETGKFNGANQALNTGLYSLYKLGIKPANLNQLYREPKSIVPKISKNISAKILDFKRKAHERNHKSPK